MYKLIAFDMDGTLLNSEKRISTESKNAIAKATKEEKIVILNTGRCVGELEEYLKELPEVRYINCLSGAKVMDVKENKTLYSKCLSIDTIKKILSIAVLEDTMIQIQDHDTIIQTSCWKDLAKFSMAQYQDLFDRVAVKWDNIVEQYLANPFEIGKINIYHTDAEARERTKQRLVEAGLDLEMVHAEKTSVELSVKGVDKGDGLKKLCEALQLPIEETIVVGDADNDIQALKVAGLAVAMENANDRVKAISDTIVADCDHDGCVEAIEKYLLI